MKTKPGKRRSKESHAIAYGPTTELNRITTPNGLHDLIITHAVYEYRSVFWLLLARVGEPWETATPVYEIGQMAPQKRRQCLAWAAQEHWRRPWVLPGERQVWLEI